MAAGTVVFSFIPGTPQSVPDNSCASVLVAARKHNDIFGSATWKPSSCSTDPVNTGTSIFWFNTLAPTQTGAWTISSISATPTGPDPTTPIDLDPLISVVIACFIVLLFFIGYGTGLHVNR
jgi:hypothetical protein